MQRRALATVLMFACAIIARAEPEVGACDFHESAVISFSSPNAADRIDVHAQGKPCEAGSLELRVVDAKGRQIYRFQASIAQLVLAGDDMAHWTQLLVKKMAHDSIVQWTEIPDIDNPTAEDAEGNVEFAVAPSLYREFRKQRLPVLQHFTYNESWQALVFDGSQSVVIVRSGH